jgi:hypothetical protein
VVFVVDKKWHWDRFFSEFFSFLLLILFHHCSIFTHVSSGEMENGPVSGCRSMET